MSTTIYVFMEKNICKYDHFSTELNSYPGLSTFSFLSSFYHSVKSLPKIPLRISKKTKSISLLYKLMQNSLSATNCENLLAKEMVIST